MAESGPIEGLLGGGDAGDGEAAAAVSSLDPAAAAVAIDAAKDDPALAAEAAAYFRKQSGLIDLQVRYFDEERRLGNEAAARKRYGDRVRNALATIAAIAAAGLLIIIGAMVWAALNDHGLVIDAFSVPPDLARDGLTGEVVAARFLDRLQAMQSATNSERPADSYQNNWGSQIKVEIPQTGLTFGEFERLLRDRLGHGAHVTGEVVRMGGGIAVTARLGDAPPQTFAGQESDFDSLAQKAAEAVYRTSQPYRFSQFLSEHGRVPEAFEVISNLAANGPRGERGWAYAQWGLLDLNEHGDVRAARAHSLEGMGFTNAQSTLAEIVLVGDEVWSGHDEKALEYSKDIAARAQKRSTETTEANFEANRVISAAYLASLVGDLEGSARLWLRAETSPDYFGSRRLSPALAATAYALDHDPAAARAAIAGQAPNDDASYLRLDAEAAFSALPAYWIAAETQDWPAALADARACDGWLEGQKASHALLGLLQPVWIRPLEALALARTGDVAGAEALIATTPTDCYLCLRERGAIAATKKDWPVAERWFAQAARLGPSLPFAFSEWGEMRLAKGDLAGAMAVFRIAHERGPRFADPLKGWGDALARQGRWSDAVARYDEALKFAPAWKELRRARDAATRGSG